MTATLIDGKAIAARMRAGLGDLTPAERPDAVDLSRSLAVAVGDVLVIAVPGSPKGALESFDAVAPILAHTLEILAGYTQHRGG